MKRSMISIELAIWLGIAALVIVTVFAPITARVLGGLFGLNHVTPTQKYVMEGKTSLAAKLGKLDNGKATSETHLLDIQKGYVLFGFNKVTQYLKWGKGGLFSGAETINKPASCLGQTCICLCKNWDCSRERPQCERFSTLTAIVVKNFNGNKGKNAENMPGCNVQGEDCHWLAVGGNLHKSFKMTLDGKIVKMYEE